MPTEHKTKIVPNPRLAEDDRVRFKVLAKCSCNWEQLCPTEGYAKAAAEYHIQYWKLKNHGR